MTEKKDLLRSALRESITNNYSCIPDEKSVDYKFSERFEKKINKITVWDELPPFFTPIRKAIITAALIIILLLTVGCAIPAIREPMLDYFIASYKNKNVFLWNDAIKQQTFTATYLPAYIPDGFKNIHCESSESEVYSIYERPSDENNTFAMIEYKQTLIPDSGVSTFSEIGTLEKAEYTEKDVYIYSLFGIDKVICEHGGYLIMFTCRGNTDTNDILKMISSLKEAEITVTKTE